jgi:hypothetical protein
VNASWAIEQLSRDKKMLGKVGVLGSEDVE